MLKVRIYYGILLAGCLCFYFLFADYVSFLILTIFLVLPILLWIVNFIATKKVKFGLKMPSMISEQSVGSPIKVTIDNESVFPIGDVRISIVSSNHFSKETFRDVISVPVAADNVTVIKTNVISNHVGKITMQIDKVVCYDILKLTSITKKPKIKQSYYVLPMYQRIYLDLMNKDAIDEESNTYSEKKGTVPNADILAYHEYGQGDMIKNINWKLSSRLNSLMVKEFAEPISNSALILYELQSNPQKGISLNQIDTSIQTICSVMQWLYENNIGHRIAWYNDTVNALCEANVKSQEDQIAMIQQIEECTFYQEPKALVSILKGIQEHSYSNIFYITAALDDITANILTELSVFGKLNVLAIQNIGDHLAESVVELLTERDIHYITLNEDDLQNQLQNIIG